MNKEQILNAIKVLAKTQGFYGRLYEFLTSGTDKAVAALSILEVQHFGDSVDMVLYIEG